MSVLVENEFGWVVSHETALNDIYSSRTVGSCIHLKYKADFFNITTPYKMDSQLKAEMQTQDKACLKQLKRKRKRKEPLNEGEKAALCFHQENKDILYRALTSLVDLAKQRGFFQLLDPHTKGDNNKQSRVAAAEVGPQMSLADLCMAKKNEADEHTSTVRLFENGAVLSESPVGQVCLYDGNESLLIGLLSEQFVIPPRSCFLLSDIKGLQENIRNLGRYNLIVMDPPWHNKSAKRKKVYWSLKNEDLLELPISKLAEDDCLVVVWATNKQAQHNFIQECLFSAWEMEFLAHWLWLKVTKSGEPVCDLDSPHKKPYESLIIGHHCKLQDQCQHSCIPDKMVITSIPCSLHSKKPPLYEVLKSYVPSKSRCLELFARNLWPGWTSWGNEVLLHQHIDFFEPVT